MLRIGYRETVMTLRWCGLEGTHGRQFPRVLTGQRLLAGDIEDAPRLSVAGEQRHWRIAEEVVYQ
jgi:hypothetical protein